MNHSLLYTAIRTLQLSALLLCVSIDANADRGIQTGTLQLNNGYLSDRLFEESYLSVSEKINLDMRSDNIGILRLFANQLDRRDYIESLVVIGSSAMGRGSIDIIMNNRVIGTFHLSEHITSIQIPIRGEIERDIRMLQIDARGNIQIEHIGLAIEKDIRRGRDGGAVLPGPRPPAYPRR